MPNTRADEAKVTVVYACMHAVDYTAPGPIPEVRALPCPRCLARVMTGADRGLSRLLDRLPR